MKRLLGFMLYAVFAVMISNTVDADEAPTDHCFSKYNKLGLVNKVNLSVAYLFRPELANKSNVKWGYYINKFDDTIILKVAGVTMFVSGPTNRDYQVLREDVFDTVEDKAAFLKSLTEELKPKGIKLGLALNDPKLVSASPDVEMIDWNPSIKAGYNQQKTLFTDCKASFFRNWTIK